MDITNKNWNRTISEEEIFNREFNIGYLIQSNQHLELFQDLKEKVLSTYKVKAKFKYMGFNGDSIYANGQLLVYRNNKNSGISIGKNVTLLEHNLNTKGGGSNKYPRVSHETAECLIEFISYGLPFVDRINGWSIEIITIDKI